jgi:hypothetical protein
LTIGTVDTLAAGSSATASITGLAPSQTLNLGIPSGLTGVAGVNGSLNEPSVQQFAADGSVLRNLPARVIGAEQLLKQAVWWIDAAHSSATGQSVRNLGWGGTALNAQLGSAGSADSNDPKYLDWDGENYVYLPGASSNYLSVPDADNLDITGDLDLRVRVAMDDWTPGAASVLLSKWGAAGQRSYHMYLNTSGRVLLGYTTDGTTEITATSTVSPTVSDGAALWIRSTLDADNGASGRTVTFYTSSDGITWTQLGDAVTTAGTVTLHSGTYEVQVGIRAAAVLPAAGKFYRAQVLNGIDGTPVLDVDCSQIGSGSATSFAALTGQTVTVNRSTTGRKTVAVTHPLWLLGTDDYMEVADSDLIDFGASDSFTALVVSRQWALASQTVMAKAVDVVAAGTGWVLRTAATTGATVAMIKDGTNIVNPTATAPTAGQLGTRVLRRDVAADTVDALTNGTAGTASTDTTTGSLANSEVLRVGRLSGAGTTYGEFEFVAAAVFRRALTASEITTITNYYAGRIG